MDIATAVLSKPPHVKLLVTYRDGINGAFEEDRFLKYETIRYRYQMGPNEWGHIKLECYRPHALGLMQS
jgi:hypothetical protein